MFSVAAGALLMRSVNDAHRAQAQSVYNGGFLVGGVMGPAFGGLLIAISPRAPFFVYAVTLIFASLTAFFFLHEKRLGKSIENLQRPEDRIKLMDALKIYPYRVALVISFLSNWVLFGMRNSILPLFVTQTLHSSPFVMGLGFTTSAIAQGILMIYAGSLSDSKGRKFGLLVGSSFLMSATLMLIFATLPWYFFVSMILFGFGGAFMGSAPASVVGDLFGGKGGQVIALWQMAGDAGMILAPLILGFLADSFSYKVAFEATAAIFTIAILLAMTLPETRNNLKTLNVVH